MAVHKHDSHNVLIKSQALRSAASFARLIMMEPENWFDPEFRDFINNEILSREIGWLKQRYIERAHLDLDKKFI
jgi:hypothetical protein